jgi:hypothetical protein
MMPKPVFRVIKVLIAAVHLALLGVIDIDPENGLR